MKKKIVDLTIREMRKICDTCKHCSRCKLWVEEKCALSDSRFITAKGLEKEVEIDANR